MFHFHLIQRNIGRIKQAGTDVLNLITSRAVWNSDVVKLVRERSALATIIVRRRVVM